MSKFKHGDEVWVKGRYDEYDTCIDQHYVDFYDEAGAWVHGHKIIPAEEIEGLDSWKLAARIAGLSMAEFNSIFGEATMFDIFNEMSPVDVKQKLDLYEQSKIQMGDLVEIEYFGDIERGIFVGDNGDDYYYILIPGYKCVQRFRQSTHIITKIKHKALDILAALENIKELSEESEDKR